MGLILVHHSVVLAAFLSTSRLTSWLVLVLNMPREVEQG